MLKLNDVVSVQHGSRYGVVVELFDNGRRKLARVHYIDPKTGDKQVCVDHIRCGSTDQTCPIHGVSVETHTLTPWPAKDVAFYVNEGMLSKEIARKHLAPVIRITRRKSHVYDVETLEHGMVTRKVKTDPEKGDEWQTAVALCNTLPYGKSALLTDPDTEDYAEFARMFAEHPLGPVCIA
jgi:hypothetical protein